MMLVEEDKDEDYSGNTCQLFSDDFAHRAPYPLPVKPHVNAVQQQLHPLVEGQHSQR